MQTGRKAVVGFALAFGRDNAEGEVAETGSSWCYPVRARVFAAGVDDTCEANLREYAIVKGRRATEVGNIEIQVM